MTRKWQTRGHETDRHANKQTYTNSIQIDNWGQETD